MDKCFICGENAYIDDRLENLFVRCPACGQYRVTKMAKRFYFDNPDCLNEDDYAKLRDHLTINTIVFDAKLIKKIAGK